MNKYEVRIKIGDFGNTETIDIEADGYDGAPGDNEAIHFYTKYRNDKEGKELSWNEWTSKFNAKEVIYIKKKEKE